MAVTRVMAGLWPGNWIGRPLAPWLALLAAFCVCAAPVRAQPVQLNLLAWGDYVDPRLLTEFTARTGIEVVYDSYDNNEAALRRLLARPGEHDVVIVSGPVLAQAVKAGRLRPFAPELAASFRSQWPEIADRLKAHDPQGRHGLTYAWGTIGLGLNPRKLQERLGAAAPVNSWDLVLKPEMAARLKDCGIALPEGPDDVQAIALAQTGARPDSREARDQQKAVDALMRVRGSVRAFLGADHINGLATGDLCLAVSSSLDVMQARKRAEEARNGVDIRHIIPREGAPLWFDVLAILADARQAEAAEQFVRFLSEPAIAARTAEFLTAAPGNRAALDLISRETRDIPGLFPDEATLKKLYAVAPLEGPARQTLLRQWQRIRTGK